jgi:hypothetical protein
MSRTATCRSDALQDLITGAHCFLCILKNIEIILIAIVPLHILYREVNLDVIPKYVDHIVREGNQGIFGKKLWLNIISNKNSLRCSLLI